MKAILKFCDRPSGDDRLLVFRASDIRLFSLLQIDREWYFVMGNRRQLYVAWVRFQRRPHSMRSVFEYDLIFVPTIARNTIVKVLLSYPAQTLRTLCIILQNRPQVLWLQIPPSILIHLAWACLLFSRHTIIVVDLHNSAFSPLWFNVPFTKYVLNKMDLILVHNEVMHSHAIECGIEPAYLRVLEDKLPEYAAASEAPISNDRLSNARPRFVMPCSFGKDEPVAEVIAAARMLPQLDFLITGDSMVAQSRDLMRELPINVTFTGFLDLAEYDRLLQSASGILCLTKEDGIQLSAASEALAAARPMIISETPLLRSLFNGIFVENTIEGIRRGCLKALVFADPSDDAIDLESRRVERAKRWNLQAAEVQRILDLQVARRDSTGNSYAHVPKDR